MTSYSCFCLIKCCCNAITSSSGSWSEKQRATNSESSLLLSCIGSDCWGGRCLVPVHLLILCQIILLLTSLLFFVSHASHDSLRILLQISLYFVLASVTFRSKDAIFGQSIFFIRLSVLSARLRDHFAYPTSLL